MVRDLYYVVMGNDFPSAVFDTQKAADAYCEKKRNLPKPQGYHGPSIYWRVYTFPLNAEEA